MKILHTADWHLGKKLNDYSRVPEQIEVLTEVCQIADDHDVDIVLIAGDLFDTFNPGADAIELFYKTLHKLAKNGKRAVIAIAGNHDSADRIEAPDPLARECGIFLSGRPKTQINACSLDCGLEITNSAPGFIELKLPNYSYPLRLILAPYANEQNMRQFLGTENREEELRRLLEQNWQQLANQWCDEKGVNILMAHLYFMQEGAVVTEEHEDEEKPILHIGGAQAIYTSNIPKQIQYVALGHLHRFQIVDKNPCPVVYSSSPLSYSFSEAGQQKFVVILEAQPQLPVKIQAVKLTSGKKLVRKRFEDVQEAVAWLNDNPYTFIELTLVSDTYIDAKTKKSLYQAHDGIVNIIPEIKGQTINKEEGPAKIDLNKNIQELFKDYFISKRGQEPNEQILTLLNEIIEKEAE
jgi:DNA repair protein SbcD/Mre11